MRNRMQSRATAWIITLLVVMFAALLGGRASLSKLRGEAYDLYRGSGDSVYASIEYDTLEIAANASNLLTVAERYVDPADLLIESVRGDIAVLESAQGPKARRAAAELLRQSVDSLNGLLGTLPLDETDLAYRSKLTVNIESRYKTIGNNGYNAAATDFNRELNRLPAEWIAAVTGVKPLELYQ